MVTTVVCKSRNGKNFVATSGFNDVNMSPNFEIRRDKNILVVDLKQRLAYLFIEVHRDVIFFVTT